MSEKKEVVVADDLAPYTRKFSTRQDRLDFRCGVSFMPKSAVIDRIMTLFSVPFVLMSMPLMFVYSTFIFFCSSLLNLQVKPSETNRSAKNGGSMTARGTLIYRTMGAVAGFGPDNFANKFWKKLLVKEGGAAIAVVSAIVSFLLQFQWKLTKTIMIEQMCRLISPFGGGVCFLQCRTCWFDDVVESFADAHREEPSQLVICGAGYDSRSYRLNLPKTMTRFEVDAPGTQLMKREMLQELGTKIKNTIYVSVDIDREQWMQKLIEAGFQKNQPTCFVMEGLVYYLDKSTVQASLRQVSECGKGSVVCFDYFHPDKVFDPNVQSWFRSTGEPWKFGLRPEDLEDLLHASDLRLLESPRFATVYDRSVPKRPNGLYLGNIADDAGAWYGLCVAGN